jgi:hypothetical protein
VARGANLTHIAGQAWIRCGATMPGKHRRDSPLLRLNHIKKYPMPDGAIAVEKQRNESLALVRFYGLCLLRALVESMYLLVSAYLGFELHVLIESKLQALPSVFEYLFVTLEFIFLIASFIVITARIVMETMRDIKTMRERLITSSVQDSRSIDEGAGG